jgi:DNA-binding MarR family transcriptional regulator
MNIDRTDAAETSEHFLRAQALYATVPRWHDLLEAVRAGHAEFAELLASTGLLNRFGLSTSAVHDYQDIEVHAFILGIVSAGRREEIKTKSFLTYASHWIDDFFDGDQEKGNFAQLVSDRHDITRALARMGPAGAVGFAMARRARHPAAVLRALKRMLYGGLVQRSTERPLRRRLVEEYAEYATQLVAPDLAREIRRLQPEAYWTTNKTVLELLYSAEAKIDFTTTELWNLVYAPAIYSQDVDEERARGELSFEDDEAPRLSELLGMIRLGARRLARRYRPKSLELRQLRYAASALPNLPCEALAEYRAFWDGRVDPRDGNRIRRWSIRWPASQAVDA